MPTAGSPDGNAIPPGKRRRLRRSRPERGRAGRGTLPCRAKTTTLNPPRESVLDRFLRYVRIDTQSREGVDTTPSTEKQWPS